MQFDSLAAYGMDRCTMVFAWLSGSRVAYKDIFFNMPYLHLFCELPQSPFYFLLLDAMIQETHMWVIVRLWGAGGGGSGSPASGFPRSAARYIRLLAAFLAAVGQCRTGVLGPSS